MHMIVNVCILQAFKLLYMHMHVHVHVQIYRYMYMHMYKLMYMYMHDYTHMYLGYIKHKARQHNNSSSLSLLFRAAPGGIRTHITDSVDQCSVY